MITLLIPIGLYSIYLAFILAWISFLLHWQKDKLKKIKTNHVIILITLVTIFLWIALIILISAFITSDYSLILVYENSDNKMSLIDKFMATWGVRQGAMLLWAVIEATIVLLVFYFLKDSNDSPVSKRISTALLFFSALIITFSMSSRPGIFETQATQSDGLGLAPSLLNFWQEIHAPIAFSAYAVFTIPFAIAIGVLSFKNEKIHSSRKINWLNDFSIFLGWGLTTLFVICGSIWAYEVNWSAFWYWSPVQTSSLILWLGSALYFHTKAITPSNHPLRFFTASFGWLGVAFAAFIIRGGLLDDDHTYAGSALTIIFGLLLLGSILAILIAVKKGKQEIFPKNLFYLKSTTQKTSFLTFWIFFIVIIGNIIGLITQMTEVILFDHQSDFSFFYGLFNGLLLILLAFLLVICERKSKNWIDQKNLSLGVSFFVLAFIIFFVIIPNPNIILLPILAIVTSLLGLQVVNIVSLFSSRINLRKLGIRLTHFIIILVLLSYFIVDPTTRESQISLNIGESADISEFEITIKFIKREIGNLSNILLEIIDSSGNIIGKPILSLGDYKGSTWTKTAWLITPFYDIYLHLDSPYHGVTLEGFKVYISVLIVPLVNLFRLTILLTFIVFAFGTVSLWKKNKIKTDENKPIGK
jgi:cytochrome c biogenesis factor